MIYLFGHKLPTARQKAHIKNRADGSFSSQISDLSILENVPQCEIGKPDSAIALKMKCVEAHRDMWVGDGDAPEKYLAVFWLTKSSSGLTIQVGDDAKKLQEGDFIVFDDTVMHSVYSKNIWFGIAYQIGINISK